MTEEEEPQEEEEDENQQYVFGIPVPDMNEGVQPLECLILIKGINMEDGSPTMTTIGSEGITPWEAIGMMDVEMERLKFMTVYSLMSNDNGEDEEYEEE